MCIIHSASSGSILLIPREDRVVRLYAQLQGDETAETGVPFDLSKIKPEVILAAAQKILDPYKITYVHCS
jgi:phenol 2-monooxygenase